MMYSTVATAMIANAMENTACFAIMTGMHTQIITIVATKGGKILNFYKTCCDSAPFHSITSSVMASSDGGTSMPSALAVPRLMTNSNLTDWTTGRSAGLAPLRMLPV
jgi:hypothetical protein